VVLLREEAFVVVDNVLELAIFLLQFALEFADASFQVVVAWSVFN
jgi:hypothetical protein